MSRLELSLHQPRRSPSRRRRSSTSDYETALLKVRRTGVRIDVSPYRRSFDSDGLCHHCKDLDLHTILSNEKHIASPRGHFIAYLDWNSHVPCELCEFLKSMRVSLPSSSNNAELLSQEHGYHLRIFSATTSYREVFCRPPNRKRQLSGDTMLAVVQNGLFSSKDREAHYGDTFGAVGYILPVAYSSTAPWLTGREIDPSRVNFPLVQEWLRFCKKKHSCSMRYSRPDKLRMIDCKIMEIVPAPPNCNYFTLSYVWGKPKHEDVAPPSLLEPHSTPEILKRAAPVVKDAIDVVKRLGWRYLWVDKYCIPQADAELKSEQIRKMDLIYEGAYCTIVAAVGENDQYGLPGISRRRRMQPAWKTRDRHFVSTLQDPQTEIRKSVWMTRAWTFQEAFCSARCLVFTDHQVYFECKSMHCCESVEIPLNILHSPDYKTLQSHVRPTLFRDEWLQGTHRFGPMSAFWSVVSLYSNRQMTYDSDALNALEGVLRRFQASPSFVYNILGIPLHAPNRAEKAVMLNPTLFIQGLSWSHKMSPRRRIQFPSWTWAGWEGLIEHQKLFGSVKYDTSMKLSVQQRDGKILPWNTFWDKFWVPDRKEECLRIFECLVVEADVFKVELVQSNVKVVAPSSKNQARCEMVNPYNGLKYASIVLPQHLVDSPRLTTELWDCVVLGKKAKHGWPDIMLIRWSLDFAERIWAGTLFSYGNETSLPPSLRKNFRLR